MPKIKIVKVALDIPLKNAFALSTPHTHGACSVHTFFPLVVSKAVPFSQHEIVKNLSNFLHGLETVVMTLAYFKAVRASFDFEAEKRLFQNSIKVKKNINTEKLAPRTVSSQSENARSFFLLFFVAKVNGLPTDFSISNFRTRILSINLTFMNVLLIRFK